MAAERNLPTENPVTTRWQVSMFLEQECGYRPISGRHSRKIPDSLEFEHRLTKTDAFPRYHLLIDFPNPNQIKTTLFFNALGNRTKKRDPISLGYKQTEILRILAKLEDFHGSEIHRLLTSSLNNNLLFQTSADLQEIKQVTNHDLKQELISYMRSSFRLKNVQRSRFIRKKEELALQDLSQY